MVRLPDESRFPQPTHQVPTQHALHRLRLLQDRATGGWPITPGGPPSTTATAWAIMALESAEMTQRLDASPSTVAAASEFLEGEQGNETAAGVLSRFLLARRLDPPLVQRGVEFLRSFNPSTADSAGNYFASQVARYGPRDTLASWNSQLRPLLIGSQVSSGHARGSWQPSGAAASIAGGRLYETAMQLLSLEVYFRHLPVWRDDLRQ